MSDLPPEETPAHPPIAPPPAVAAARTKSPCVWPRVLGIVAIVFGSLGVLGGCMGLLFPILQSVFEDAVSKGGGPDIFGTMQGWQGWTLAGSVLGMVISVLLIVEGIGLLRRRPWSIRLGYCWAVLKITFVLVNSIVGYFIQRDIQQAMFQEFANQGTPMPPIGPGFFEIMGAFGIVVGIVWGWALPVFLIVWFSRSKIRAEVADWSVAAARADRSAGG